MHDLVEQEEDEVWSVAVRSIREGLGIGVLFHLSCYYRKRGSASYIVREVLSVRERKRDRRK